jgi:arginase
MGPSAIRYAGLDARLVELGHDRADWGNVDAAVPEATAVGDEHARFLPQIKETCARVAHLAASTTARRTSRSSWWQSRDCSRRSTSSR